MSFFDKLSADMVKYSKKFVNKTDIVAQIAKLNIDIKKKNREIVKIKIEIGDYVLEQYDKTDKVIDDILQSKIEKINTIKSELDHIKIKIESLKSQLWESESKMTKNEDINNPPALWAFLQKK